jgi:DNA helicase-2/ATP-dependent DNA helicase PcrA
VPDGEDFPEYRPKDALGSIHFRPHSWAYPESLIRDLLADVEEGHEAMILASCGYMLTPLVELLRERGIPFHNPYRTEHGGWNPLRYGDRVRAFLRPKLEGKKWSWNDLRLFTEPLAAKDVMHRGAKSHIEGMCEAQFGNDDHAHEELPFLKSIQYFKDEHADALFDCDLDWLLQHARASRRSVLEYPIKVAKNNPAALNEKPKIIIGTIHSVKGGEADSVYVFPDLSRKGFESWNRRGMRDAIYRQFYVALTRTKDKLTILEPNGSEYVPLPRSFA